MIQFAHPAALWLLTLIIPIVLLYLLKQKRRDIEVPSVLLWKQAIEDLRAHTPFQKLRTNLLLLLQVLILVLLTAVLSQPYLPKGIHESRRIILVIDASASMKARDAKPDRFSAAKEELQRVVDSLSASNEVMLISFSARASILQPFTTNINAARKSLATVEPQDVAGEWKELSLLLQPLSKTNPKPRIVIASDFAGFPSDFGQGISFDPIVVGSATENIGIIRATMQPLPDNPSRQLLFYQFKNFGTQAGEADVEIRSDSTLIDAFHTSLPPQKEEDRTIELTVNRPIRLQIQIQDHDVFPLDNNFVLFAKPAEPYRVKVLLKDPFLLKALEALPLVRISDRGIMQISDKDLTGPGISFLPAAPDAPPGEIIQWNASHPVLRFVNAGIWRFNHVTLLKLPESATTLLEMRNGTVGYAWESPQGRKLVFGFSLPESNLYLRAGFPVFLQNALEWIHSGVSAPAPIYTSAEFPLEGPIGKDAYVNFADAAESNIAPQHPVAVSHSGTGSLSFRRDLSRWFLILLIAVIIVEWWAFHQRIHVEA